MPVNVNVTVSDEAHQQLEYIKKLYNLRNYAEAIEFIIRKVAEEEVKTHEL